MAYHFDMPAKETVSGTIKAMLELSRRRWRVRKLHIPNGGCEIGRHTHRPAPDDWQGAPAPPAPAGVPNVCANAPGGAIPPNAGLRGGDW